MQRTCLQQICQEKFGKTLEITDGQHFATLFQTEAAPRCIISLRSISGTPIDGRSLCWNHASWFAKTAPCSPNSWLLGLFSLIFTNGTTLISNDLVKWLKLSRVEAAGAFDSAMHLTRLGHFWCQRGSIQITIKRVGGVKIFHKLFQHLLRYTSVM